MSCQHLGTPRAVLKAIGAFRTTRGCPKGNPPFGHGWADLGGGAKCRHSISHNLQTNLGYNILRIPQFVTPSRRTSGGAKTHGVVSHNLKTDLGGAFSGFRIVRPPPDRPRGSLKGGVPFRYPLPDFPVHRGHRISTYRLPIDNSLSFPCLDGQC